MGTIGSTKSSPGWLNGLSDAPKSSTLPTRIRHLAKSGTIWVKILPMPGHGELFPEMVLWPKPKAGSGASGPRNRHSRELCCTGCAAGATLNGLWCRGYAAEAMLQGLCCRNNATRAMLQGLPCRLHRSPRSTQCSGHKDQRARHELLLHS